MESNVKIRFKKITYCDFYFFSQFYVDLFMKGKFKANQYDIYIERWKAVLPHIFHHYIERNFLIVYFSKNFEFQT